MNAQIDQTEKTQGAFIVYENVLFIRGKVKKLTEKTQEKVACKPASAVDWSRSPTAMKSCLNNLLINRSTSNLNCIYRCINRPNVLFLT